MRYIKNVMVLGAPLLAGLISEFFMYLSDSVMVGRLGTQYLAAMGIAVMVAEILWIIIWPLAPATQTIASRRYGRALAIKKKESNEYKNQILSTGDVFNNSLFLALGAGIIAVLSAKLCNPFLSVVLEDPGLIPMVNRYVNIVKWAMPMAAIFYALYGFLAAINRTIPIMIATIGWNVLNIFFNYVLIFGKFGCPAMGMEGAAIGTVLSQAIGAIYLTAYVLTSNHLRQFKCFIVKAVDTKIFKALLKAGTPITGQLVVVFVIYLYYETLIANIGMVYLAATHIVFMVFFLKRAIVGGFAEGGSILVGNNLGRKNKDEAVKYAFAAEWVSIVIGVILFLLILIFPENIARVFNSESRTVAVSTDALRFFALFMLIDIIGYPFEVIFTHNGWARFVFLADVGTHVAFLLGLP
ncbi:MAG: MATE family efflux transporter, partial [Desulfobacteraceae bacterium]|nr:MATE family efflux transporter [Desulfobacteraceae bacterium]